MVVAFVALLGWSLQRAEAAENADRPNVLLILADDLGFSDLGCYGGEIATPNLDRLATGGLRGTQFYNTARCWPSRAAILTGYYPQAVRRDEIPGLGGGGAGQRPPWALLAPVFLKAQGYRSYHSGKWHVDGLPLAGGFDRSYLVVDQDRFFSPRVHYEDDVPLPAVAPDSGYYATVAIADHAIKCLRDHEDSHKNQPFFHYLAFTCPHFPLHALPEDIARYRDRYAAGWDVLRAERLERMRALGIVSCQLSPRTPGVPAWNALSSDEQSQWQTRMAIHAAMVDRMDREIGRVLAQLQDMKALDNTLVMFLSDNGASAEKILRGDGHDPEAPPGSARSYQCLEPGWANLANAPLRRSKIFVHEGGIATPLIMYWPRRITACGQLRHAPGHVVDLLPTILEVTGSKKPDAWQDQPLPPGHGRSLVPLLTQDQQDANRELWWFHTGNRAVRIGNWKLVSEKDQPWELYDLANDRSESHDVAGDQPQRVDRMQAAWLARLETFRQLAYPEPAPPASDKN
jgi:arylsulfatase